MEIGSSLAGVRNAELSLGVRGDNIANVSTEGFAARRTVVSGGEARVDIPQPERDTDLAEDLPGSRQDVRDAGYNLQAIKVQDRLQGTLLDLVG